MNRRRFAEAWKKLLKWMPILSASLLVFIAFFALTATATLANEEERISQIAFTSDYHEASDNLIAWLEGIKPVAEKVDYLAFGGDYTGAAAAASLDSLAQGIYGDAGIVKANGNHEYDNGGSWTAATGLMVREEDYAVYTVLSPPKQAIDGQEIFRLEAALQSLPADLPVFVVSHYPLHTAGGRTTENARKMIAMLNRFPNVIYLWGHNHSVEDPGYGRIRFAGESLETSPGVWTGIRFTYANMGSVKRPVNGAGGCLATVVRGPEGRTVEFRYMNLKGETVSEYRLELPGR